jgi:hypothetical protein
MLGHALRPARGGALAVVLVFAVLLTLASHAGLFGIPMALIIGSWFFKYAYILFDHTVHGFDEPPVLDILNMGVFAEQRPLGQVIIGALAATVVLTAAHHVGFAAAAMLAALFTLTLPASVAVLGIECHLLRAANPLAWLRMAWHLGVLYGVVLGVIVLYAASIAAAFSLGLWTVLDLIICLFALLSIFSALAGAVYERRHVLGMEPWAAPEIDAERERRAALRRSEKLVTEAYGLMRAGRHIDSWNTLQGWLRKGGRDAEDYRWLCSLVATWGDARYVTRLTQDYVERLLALKRSGTALDAVAARLALDPAFRPRSAADTLVVAQLAARGGGKPGVARQLLADFDARFPNDPRTATAQALAMALAS